MNLTQTKAVIEAYRKTAPAQDMARLDFFYGIWEIQERHAQIAREAMDPDTLPAAETLAAWYWDMKPFMKQVVFPVDAARFAAAAAEIAGYLVENGSFGEDACKHLKRIGWKALVETEPMDLAGTDPAGYLDALVNDVMEEEDETPETFERLRLTCMVLSLALRTQIEPAACAALDRVDKLVASEEYQHQRPLLCPVCGGEAVLAHVGPTSHNKNNVRTLYCGQCGGSWGVERVRCARCGTQHQEKLEYVSVEGDDMHRAHVCSECGGYMRTHFYSPDNRTAFVPQVEDVMMVSLDALAAAGKLKA